MAEEWLVRKMQSKIAGIEDGGRGPQAQKCGQPLKDRKDCSPEPL